MKYQKTISARIIAAGFVVAISLIVSISAPIHAAAEPLKVDAAFNANGYIYLFRQWAYWRFKGNVVEKGYPKTLNRWKGLERPFLEGLDAAFYHPDRKKIYMFKGSKYVRITKITVDEKYPKSIGKAWKGLPKRFHSDLDAAIFRKGKTYFFKNNEYVRLTGSKMDAGYPLELPGGWGLPKSFGRRVDAALSWRDKSKNYFFQSDKYARLSDVKLDDKYPAPIRKGWLGLDTETRLEVTKTSIPTTLLINLLNTTFKGTKLRLDNYNGSYKENDSRLTLPKKLTGGKKPTIFDIPEGRWGPFFYYVNDIDSTGFKFYMSGKKIALKLSFEGNGTEIPGRCLHDAVLCVLGDDATAPDVEWNNLSVIVTMKPKASNGQIYLVKPAVTVTGAPEIQGLCNAIPVPRVDLCDIISDYKNIMRIAVASALQRELNKPALRERLASVIQKEILSSLKIASVESIKVAGGNFEIRHEKIIK